MAIPSPQGTSLLDKKQTVARTAGISITLQWWHADLAGRAIISSHFQSSERCFQTSLMGSVCERLKKHAPPTLRSKQSQMGHMYPDIY